MNSLKWINKQIEECKQAIQQLKIRIDEDKNYPSLIKCHNERLEELKPILQTLQKVKTELEAWYSVKLGLIYKKESKHRMSEEMRCAYTIYLTDDEMESIQKGLEVKENA